MELIWAINALQSGRADVAARLIRHPPEAVTVDFRSPYHLPLWALESVLVSLLSVPKSVFRNDGRNRVVDCRQFGAAHYIKDLLLKVERAEAKAHLKYGMGVLELHRIAHRQLQWQRGWFNKNQFYRNLYIFGQGECAAYFERQYGLTVDQFNMVGFGFLIGFNEMRWVNRYSSMEAVGLDGETVELALRRMCLPIEEMRTEQQNIIGKTSKKSRFRETAYRPSLLRQFPIVAFGARGERLRSPIKDLILQRITSGLYYDVVRAGTRIHNEANRRFESYARDFITRMMPTWNPVAAYEYRYMLNRVATPDVLIEVDGVVQIVIECKATKLTLDAQFSVHPLDDADSAYNQIAKGVAQLWRYFSRVRRGIIADRPVSPNAYAVVLTLDDWLVMAPELQVEVINAATKLLASTEEDAQIMAEDRKAPIFCTIEDLELTLSHNDENGTMIALAASLTPQHRHWQLHSIARDLGLQVAEQRGYPFDLGGVIPWWTRIEAEAIRLGIEDADGT